MQRRTSRASRTTHAGEFSSRNRAPRKTTSCVCSPLLEPCARVGGVSVCGDVAHGWTYAAVYIVVYSVWAVVAAVGGTGLACNARVTVGLGIVFRVALCSLWDVEFAVGLIVLMCVGLAVVFVVAASVWASSTGGMSYRRTHRGPSTPCVRLCWHSWRVCCQKSTLQT